MNYRVCYRASGQKTPHTVQSGLPHLVWPWTPGSSIRLTLVTYYCKMFKYTSRKERCRIDLVNVDIEQKARSQSDIL